jgi:two-component system chemotaxis response regulator CheY
MATILVVDDSNSLRQLVAATLESAAHKVTQAKDGADGLQAAQTSRFDLVISDVNMPIMDGLTLVRRLRALPASKHIPILILTTEMDPGRRKEAKEAGATGWLVKPFNPDQLLATVRKVLD